MSPRGAILAALFAAMLAAGRVSAAADTRYCLLVDPAAAAMFPPQVLFSQMARPDGGDRLRVVVGTDRVADLALSPRPGLRTAQLLTAAKRLVHTGASAAGNGAWQPSPARCLGDDMRTHLVVAGRLAATPAPEMPAAGAPASVTLLALPVGNGNGDGDDSALKAWRQAWSPTTPVSLMPLAAPKLPPVAEPSGEA